MVRPRGEVGDDRKVGFGLRAPIVSGELTPTSYRSRSTLRTKWRFSHATAFSCARVLALMSTRQAVGEFDSRILIEDAGLNEPAVLVRRDPVKRLDGHSRSLCAHGTSKARRVWDAASSGRPTRRSSAGRGRSRSKGVGFKIQKIFSPMPANGLVRAKHTR